MILIAEVKRRNFALSWLVVAAACAATRPAQAHVELDSPNGGETLNSSAISTIAWMPMVAAHDTLNFDLWYSTVGAGGPWTVIVLDLPPGDLSVGSSHAYSWTVPNITDSSAWVRVRQENDVDQDYEDVSDGSFSIAAAAGLEGDYNGNEVVDAADYSIWRNTLGQQAAGLAADGDGNGRIETADYSVWKSNFGESAGSGSSGLAATAVPEPGSLILLFLCTAQLSAIRSLRHRAFAA